MSQYNFSGLSGFEFERVIRDLLQEAHGVQYQTSPPGPDGGIDLRRIDDGGHVTIIQCKHYSRSSVSTLLSRLRQEELAKVRELAPSRYVLVTSLGISPSVKDEITALFSPFCKSSNDVLGGEDIENMLGQFPAVADRHIKLWLTSEPVLRRVLQSGIFDDSEREVERIRRRLALYVPNESLARARRILEDQHVCVITGLPGIGKTTLAHMLLIEYESRGYTVIRVPNHLSQVLGAARRGSKTVFYFDDFLGQTVLERWERNEDQRLAEFMDTVRHEGNWRFVLTTREYILEEARLKSEALSRLQMANRTCLIQLDKDYTMPVRAKILYQHLYFSDLPLTLTRGLIRSGTIGKILAHPNYSPRLVDLLTSRSHTRSASPNEYASEFLQTLDNPQRLWGVAFRALDSAAQDLALTMASMPDEVTLDHLRRAYEAFRTHRATRLNQTRRVDEFEESLRILDGTMLRTRAPVQRWKNQIIASFHNPSVRDFLQSRLREHPNDVADLITAGVFIDQYIRLFQGEGSAPFPNVMTDPDAFVDGVSRVIDSEAAHLPSAFDTFQLERGAIGAHSQSPESRALFAFDIARVLGTSAAEQLRAFMFDRLLQVARAGEGITVSHTAAFLQNVYLRHGRDPALDGGLVDALVTGLAESVSWDNELSILMKLLDSAPALFQPQHIAATKAAVVRCANEYVDAEFHPESESMYTDAARVLSRAASRLGIDINNLLSLIEERGQNVREEQSEEIEDDRDDGGTWRSSFDVQALFDRLDGELGNRQ